MANVLYKINKATDAEQQDTQILIVTAVLNGEASLLKTLDGLEYDNKFIHASSVPHLSINDSVIVQNISGLFIITDKLRNPEEKPTAGFNVNDDGSLSLYSDVSIVLKTLNAKVDILKNGKIMIDGNEVYSLSKGINRIQGTSIELN